MYLALCCCRAHEIVSKDFVRDISFDHETRECTAKVGSARLAWKKIYTVSCSLSVDAAEPRFISSCDCPQHQQTGVCKHSVAVALTQLPAGDTAPGRAHPELRLHVNAMCNICVGICHHDTTSASTHAGDAGLTAAAAARAAVKPDHAGAPSSAGPAAEPAAGPSGAAASAAAPAAAQPSGPQTQGGLRPTQRGMQLTQGGSRKLPASLRRPPTQQPSQAKKLMQSQPKPSLPKVRQTQLKRPAAPKCVTLLTYSYRQLRAQVTLLLYVSMSQLVQVVSSGKVRNKFEACMQGQPSSRGSKGGVQSTAFSGGAEAAQGCKGGCGAEGTFLRTGAFRSGRWPALCQVMLFSWTAMRPPQQTLLHAAGCCLSLFLLCIAMQDGQRLQMA